ncbi:MAG: hypothetical protein AB3N24_13520, partial [Leisingera sp.]
MRGTFFLAFCLSLSSAAAATASEDLLIQSLDERSYEISAIPSPELDALIAREFFPLLKEDLIYSWTEGGQEETEDAATLCSADQLYRARIAADLVLAVHENGARVSLISDLPRWTYTRLGLGAEEVGTGSPVSITYQRTISAPDSLFKANVQESLKISYSDREWSFREESEYGEFTIGEGPFAFGIHFRRT